MLTVSRMTLLALACACAAQQYNEERAPRYIASESKVAPTPVPILKQINRHNEDGSYTYGYEAADGSFKIETKEANGEVKGKYGYKDDTGKVRVVEYGANKYGFQPSGEGITVAPPTLVDETRDEERRASKNNNNNYRQQQQQQQQLDYDYEETAPAPPPRPRPAPARPQPIYTRNSVAAPAPPKPQFFTEAAPAPIQGDTNLFNPAPAPKPYRAPKQQDFRPQQFTQPDFNQQNYQPRTYTQVQPSFQEQNFPQGQPTFPGQGNFQAQPSFQQPKSQGFSMLDQLLKEYALPKNGAAPLHDITFGSY